MNDETPTARFDRIAATRLGNATKALGLLCNLKEGRDYQASEDARAAILGELQFSLDELSQAWDMAAPAFIPKPEPAEPEPTLWADRADQEEQRAFAIACSSLSRMLGKAETIAAEIKQAAQTLKGEIQ